MFVIPCKYNSEFPFIIELVKSIRKFHLTEKIVVIDSDSEDKSYFSILENYDVIIEDIKNHNWMIGAYWYAYKKYSNEIIKYTKSDSKLVFKD